MSGRPLALQQGVWSTPLVKQENVSVAQGAQIIRSVISAVFAIVGSHNLFRHVLCVMPLFVQQLFMSGNWGAFPTCLGFKFSGVRVKLLTE